MISKPIVALALVASANAAVWNVTVGQGGLVFNPNTITPAVGDTIHFIFGPPSHSATQSTFVDPCNPLAGGFDSGLKPTTSSDAASEPTFDVLVNSTDPIWVHCSQVGHCQTGMVFAANPASSGQTFDAFQNAAKGISTPAGSSALAASSSASASSSSSSGGGIYGGGSGNGASAAAGLSAAALFGAGVVAVAMML